MSLATKDLFSVQGKTVVLTGASGYLGRTMAQALLLNGARVVALGRSARLEMLSQEWRSRFGESSVATHRVDMYDLKSLAQTLDQIVANEANVDVLINNAHELGNATGFNIKAGQLEEATFDHWFRNFVGGAFWPALTTQKVGPVMKAKGHGSIVNISTMYAVVAPNPELYRGTEKINPPGYSAAKAAMLAFTRYTASFWGGFGIRANAILPGPFSNTEDITENSVRSSDPFLDKLRSRTCLGRLGQPSELVGAVIFLASDASAYVTGHALAVDGGWTIT